MATIETARLKALQHLQIWEKRQEKQPTWTYQRSGYVSSVKNHQMLSTVEKTFKNQPTIASAATLRKTGRPALPSAQTLFQEDGDTTQQHTGEDSREDRDTAHYCSVPNLSTSKSSTGHSVTPGGRLPSLHPSQL